MLDVLDPDGISEVTTEEVVEVAKKIVGYETPN